VEVGYGAGAACDQSSDEGKRGARGKAQEPRLLSKRWGWRRCGALVLPRLSPFSCLLREALPG
jgi:hypothetical protein